jgi:hypothetical protein
LNENNYLLLLGVFNDVGGGFAEKLAIEYSFMGFISGRASVMVEVM